MDLSNERWESITAAERETLARKLANQLPSGFTFQTIHTFRFGQRQNHVALYQQDSATFALIPGVATTLGYDLNRPWAPNQDELESWQETSEEYGIDRTIQEHIADVTLRVRKVELSPFLIETVAWEPGWEPIGLEDSGVQRILRDHLAEEEVTVCIDDTYTRVRRSAGGAIMAERALSLTHPELTAQLAATGFRFPTSDEWEYANGAGASTLFRWGDHVPCDRYPIYVGRAEAAWEEEGDPFEDEPDSSDEPSVSDWAIHRQPNAFGLLVASNPYESELVAEIGLTRGGDGGVLICGGTGFFISWLTLATAYYEEHSCNYDPTEPVSPGYTICRRVLDLR
jgi:hypothetical protein